MSRKFPSAADEIVSYSPHQFGPSNVIYKMGGRGKEDFFSEAERLSSYANDLLARYNAWDDFVAWSFLTSRRSKIKSGAMMIRALAKESRRIRAVKEEMTGNFTNGQYSF
jgi:hypothetical protein